MLSTRTSVYVSLFVFAGVLLVSGCDSSGSEEGAPAVSSVAVTGTQVPSDFQERGEFGVSATPLDGGGNGIISEDLEATVLIERNPTTTKQSTADTITATVEIVSTRDPSGNPLAVPIVLDGSSSMFGSDPDTLRVDGANAFIDQLGRGGVDFEAAVFEFPGANASDPEFETTDFLAGFTSDVDSLKRATAKVEASGSTPMYESLAEVLAYADGLRPNADYQKAIVLLADGNPNGFRVTQDSVCTSAGQKETPIFGIGLGPASDLSDFPDSRAIAEMRGISSCTGGAYQGLSADSLEVVEEAFAAAATGSAQGGVNFNIKIETGLAQFVAGDIVRGTLTITSGGSSADGVFTFRVPDATTSTSRSYQF
jgi:hypothetical protein